MCKTWQQDQRGKPHVGLADARQTQVVGNWEGKKKIRGNLCKTPVVSNSEVSPHLQVVSKIGERISPPDFQGTGDWKPSFFRLNLELSL